MKKIISGGQTGADVAGLNAAIAMGLDYGGSIPKGRKTEAGPLALHYDRMTELSSPSYPKRTIKNIEDSDATIIFTMGKLSGGSALTFKEANKRGKPVLHIDLNDKFFGERMNWIIAHVADWLKLFSPEVLNVAGSRASKAPGIRPQVYKILVGTIGVVKKRI